MLNPRWPVCPAGGLHPRPARPHHRQQVRPTAQPALHRKAAQFLRELQEPGVEGPGDAEEAGAVRAGPAVRREGGVDGQEHQQEPRPGGEQGHPETQRGRGGQLQHLNTAGDRSQNNILAAQTAILTYYSSLFWCGCGRSRRAGSPRRACPALMSELSYSCSYRCVFS